MAEKARLGSGIFLHDVPLAILFPEIRDEVPEIFQDNRILL
jgi:hypothetical protein